MEHNCDFVEFNILKDSSPYDSAMITVNDDTIPNTGNGIYCSYMVELVPKSAHSVKVVCPNHNFSLSRYINVPDTFHITDILPSRQNPGGDTTYIYWTASQYNAGCFVVVSHPPAAGHNERVNYSSAMETILPSAFRSSRTDILIEGTYSVYVVSYCESFLLYNFYFNFPYGLPKDNLSGAKGTIGAGVIAPKDSIVVTKFR
jgi:hypothetical protein